MNPSAGSEQLVNLPTWLWLDRSEWSPRNATASAGGVTVTVVAAPTRVVWNMGNGDQVVCNGPGTPYDPSRPPDAQHTNCSYTYSQSSASEPGGAYRVTATAEWRATWSAAGAPGGGDLGVLRRSSSVSVSVAEAQALNE